MPPSPLTELAKIPDRLLPTPIERNQPPIPKPTRREGASFVTIDSPMGERQSSPTDWMKYTATRVQKGILPSSPRSLESANIRSRKAKPLNISPSPNFRTIDGLAPRLARSTH